MAITVRPQQAASLTHAFALDPALLEQPAAQAARQKGLLRAKTEALHATERLIQWARPLLIGVLIVSFLHLWHQIARIAPAGVAALPLPDWTHWLSAALLTASVDATALYLVATRSSAQYARLGEQGRGAVWFFYLLTAALNSVFVLTYTPGLPNEVQAITPVLSLVGALLLGLLVPISIAALERARQVADVARLSLLVEVETLRGIVQDAPPSMPAPQPHDPPSPAPSDHTELPIALGISGISQAVQDRACPQCQAPLNAAQYGAARRWGGCLHCRPSATTPAKRAP